MISLVFPVLHVPVEFQNCLGKNPLDMGCCIRADSGNY